MATYIVTGSAGFIGFHVAKQLLEDGHAVVGYDNLNPYYPPVLKRARHEQLAGFDRFTPVEADLCDGETLAEVVGSHEPDVFCHLAAQAGVRYSLTHPFAYERANLHAFLNVLEVCRHAGIGRLVYASSSSVYGGNEELPFSEDQPVDHPISLYAATKKANELMAHVYMHLYDLQAIGLRFFTVYGPWGRPDMAMWLFADAMSQGRPIQVFNYGKMRRDFTYVDDIVGGVVAAMQAEGLEPYEILNLGNHRCEELMHLIELVEEGLGVEGEKEMLPMQPGDVPATYADVDRARQKLGYEPTTPIEVGVPRFIAWFKEHAGLVEQVRAAQAGA
ncbi:MAG: NAD-dependent epimerase/dehydratase family protein [Planctomycetota bacterium]